MSLINDALKRAREAEQQRPPDPTPPAPLQPADHTARRNWAGWIVLAVLTVATLTFAAIHLGRWSGSLGSSPSGPTAKTRPATTPAASGSMAPPAPRPVIEADTNPAPRLASADHSLSPALSVAPARVADRAPTAPPSSPGQVASSPSEKGEARPEVEPGAAPGVPGEARFPELKLQSIVFRLRNPSVLIDGQMLSVGDTVKGARVAKIERHAVTIEWQGQTNILRLPQL